MDPMGNGNNGISQTKMISIFGIPFGSMRGPFSGSREGTGFSTWAMGHQSVMNVEVLRLRPRSKWPKINWVTEVT